MQISSRDVSCITTKAAMPFSLAVVRRHSRRYSRNSESTSLWARCSRRILFIGVDETLRGFRVFASILGTARISDTRLPRFGRFVSDRLGKPIGLAYTDVASSAGGPARRLAEVHANAAMPAIFRFGETTDHVIALPGALLLLRLCDLPDEMGQEANIAHLPQENAIRGIAVAARSSGLLIKLLDRFRQGEMNHGANSGFIDAQPKATVPTSTRTSSDIHRSWFCRRVSRVHFAMIRNRGDSLLFQEIHGFFHPANGRRVDDDVMARVIVQGSQQQGGSGCGYRIASRCIAGWSGGSWRCTCPDRAGGAVR